MYQGVAAGKGIQNLLQIDRNNLLQSTSSQSIGLHFITFIKISSEKNIVQ